MTSLSLASSATLDLGNNALIVDYPTGGPSALAAIAAAVKSAYANGAWTGPGITSGTAAASAGHGSIGYGEASALLGISATATGTFMGRAVDASSILLRYTVAGDANLDGKCDFADFVALSNHFGTATPGGWASGDFNDDDKVDFADFVLLSNNFGQVSSAPSMGSASAKAIVTTPHRTDLASVRHKRTAHHVDR